MDSPANAYRPPSAETEIPTPQGPVTDRPEVTGAFPAVRTSAWSEDVAIDVYVGADRFVAVKTGGQLAAHGTNAITAQFGLIGALVGYFLKKKADKKTAAAREDRRKLSLDELLRLDSNNFEVRLGTVESATLKKPGFFGGAGVAKLELSVGADKPMTLLLKTKEALQLCRTSLVESLGSRVQIDPKLKL